MRRRFYLYLFGLCLLHFPFLGAQEIGLQLYSLRHEFERDVEGTLSLIQQWGIRKIEGGDTYGMPLEDFLALLEKYDLEMVSILLPYETFRDAPEAAIEQALAYGVKYVGCAWIPHRDAFSFTEGQQAVQVFNRAGKLLKASGITLFYHPHGYEFRPYDNGTLFDWMAGQAVEFVFEMDVFWVRHAGQDPMELLKRFPEKFALMHLKDMEPGLQGDFSGHADVGTNVVLGQGQIDIAGLVQKARELGIPYLFLEDESPVAADQIPKSLAYLKTLPK